MNNNVYAGYVVSEPTAIAARTYTFPNISDDQIMMTLYRTYSNGQLIDIINRNFIKNGATIITPNIIVSRISEVLLKNPIVKQLKKNLQS